MRVLVTLGAASGHLVRDLNSLGPRERAARLRHLAQIGLSVEAGMLRPNLLAEGTALRVAPLEGVGGSEIIDRSFKESLEKLGF